MSLTDMSTPYSRAKQAKVELWWREQIKPCQRPQADRSPGCTGLYFFHETANGICPPCRDSEARKALEAQRVQDKEDALAAQRHESVMRRKMEMLAKNRMDSFLIDTLPQVAVAASDCIVRKRKP